MASRRANTEPLDPVRLNQLLCERVRKELKCQRLHTEYKVNPLQPVHTITRKPMSWHDNIEEPADEEFLNLIHRAALEPTKKYAEPQTESQEIGWNTKPLVRCLRTRIFAGFREVQPITVEDIHVKKVICDKHGKQELSMTSTAIHGQQSFGIYT